jgi:hypothetical protein
MTIESSYAKNLRLLLLLESMAFCSIFFASSSTNADQLANLDLVWEAGREDPNGLPENPRWFWQATHLGTQADSVPDPAKLCAGFPYLVPNDPSKGVSYGSRPCVSQQVTLDYPFGFQDFICSNFGGKAGTLHGHVDWVPARYDGLVSWKGFKPWYKLGDGDYNFWLFPPNQGGLTTANPEAISLEFDSHETINHFDSPWWSEFHTAVDDDEAKARSMVDHKYAIVLGLVGIDTEHEDHSELHPVYLMAIHEKADDPDDDVWGIFARNWDNEGYCSQNQHFLSLKDNQISVVLPIFPVPAGLRYALTRSFRLVHQTSNGIGLRYHKAFCLPSTCGGQKTAPASTENCISSGAAFKRPELKVLFTA